MAEILRLNPQAVRNWVDPGSLPAPRIGRRVRIKREVLEHVMERGLWLPAEDDRGEQ